MALLDGNTDPQGEWVSSREGGNKTAQDQSVSKKPTRDSVAPAATVSVECILARKLLIRHGGAGINDTKTQGERIGLEGFRQIRDAIGGT